MRNKFWMLSTAAAVMLLTAACGKFTIKRSANAPVAWPQLGQSPQHTPVLTINPHFPLSLVWEKRASSALGISIIAGANHIIYGTQDGKLEGLYLKDGAKIGKIGIRNTVELTAALADNRLVIVKRLGNKNITGYDLTNARIVWETNVGPVLGEPLIAGERVYLATASGRLISLAAKDGKKLADYQLSATCSTTPAFCEDHLIIGDDKGTIHALTAQLEPVWQFATGAAIRSTAVLAQGTVYLGSTDGIFYALNTEDRSLRWKTTIAAKIYHLAAVTDSLVIFGATDHKVYALSRLGGDVVWRFDCGSVLSTAPLPCGDHVFIGALNKKLYALDIARGTVAWEFTAKGRIRSYPVAIDPYLVFSSEEDYVYCFRLY